MAVFHSSVESQLTNYIKHWQHMDKSEFSADPSAGNRAQTKTGGFSAGVIFFSVAGLEERIPENRSSTFALDWGLSQRDMSLEHRVINTLEELEVIYAITRTAYELLIRTYSHTFAHVTGNCEYFQNRNWISHPLSPPPPKKESYSEP